jgi:ACR3 family arsenite efflux pump ArsB
MMYPILCKVRYQTLHRTFRSKQLWIQVGFSVLVNWIIAPFLMVSLPATSPAVSQTHFADLVIARTGMGILA